MSARWIRLGPLERAAFDRARDALARAQGERSTPILLWGEEAAYFPYALIAPLRLAPGRRERWFPWGVAAAVATYRQFGVPAYLDDELRLHGRNIAESSVLVQGACVVVSSSFLMRFPGRCVATPSLELEAAFRLRLEAQHGWQFETSWPSAPDLARAEAPS